MTGAHAHHKAKLVRPRYAGATGAVFGQPRPIQAATARPISGPESS